jgi:lipopolysaccharide/colanic/teichoic acid biosynthesis glycosyltransferase
MTAARSTARPTARQTDCTTARSRVSALGDAPYCRDAGCVPEPGGGPVRDQGCDPVGDRARDGARNRQARLNTDLNTGLDTGPARCVDSRPGAEPETSPEPGSPGVPGACAAAHPAVHPAACPFDSPPMASGKRPRDISVAKRGMDLCLLLPALVLALLPGLVITLLLLLLQGRPVFYISKRVGAFGRRFDMIKFRSMTADRAASEDLAAEGPAGGHLNPRITPLGRLLRASRLDELPQLINILRGEMSFVGPRPPTLGCAQQFPGTCREMLQRRPGLSGLATLMLFGTEARLLQHAGSDAEAAEIYRRRCLPRKVALERIYRRRASLVLDLWILAWTVLLLLSGARRPLRLRRALRRLPVLRALGWLRPWQRCRRGMLPQRSAEHVSRERGGLDRGPGRDAGSLRWSP